MGTWWNTSLPREEKAAINLRSPNASRISLVADDRRSGVIIERNLFFIFRRHFQFTFRTGHDRGGETIADEIDCRSRHVHQFVHAEDERHAFQGQAKTYQRAR